MKHSKRPSHPRIFLAALLMGFLATGSCVGIIYLDRTLPLFALEDGGTYFQSYGSFLVVTVTAFMGLAVFTTVVSGALHQRREDRLSEQERQARYSVLYDIVNRMSRDYGVLNRMRNLFPGLGVQGRFKIASTDQFIEVRDLLHSLSVRLEKTDASGQATPLDVSLLQAEEERQVIKYFDLYNDLQNEVQWLLPKAQRGAGDAEGEIDSKRRDRVVLEQGLELLFGQLLCTYQMAGEVATLLIESTNGEFASLESIMLDYRSRNLFMDA